MDGPDGRRALEALVVGGGLFGQTAAFALHREGVRRVRVVDRAVRGEEGPWATWARMRTLRSPKGLTGPDLGVPSLTYRAWHEARAGDPAAWDALHKIGRVDWRDYLLWLRETVGVGVENGVALAALDPHGATLLRAVLRDAASGREEVVYARHAVLASGRDGPGAASVPAFPSLPPGADAARRAGVFHSSEAIPFGRFAGGRVAVLGANASAFDNAAEALEAGAAEVVLSCRRPHLPQVNLSRGFGPGLLRAFPHLDDATRWRFAALLADESSPPPHESVLRCTRHGPARFAIRFGEAWRDLAPREGGGGVEVVAADGRREGFDAAILATGFATDPARTPALAAFAGRWLTWGERVGAEAAARHPDLARAPYLDAGFALTERAPGACPAVARVRLFGPAAALSHGAVAGDIPGLAVGAPRLAADVARAIYAEEAGRAYERLAAYEEPELGPTPYYVPPGARRRSPRR